MSVQDNLRLDEEEIAAWNAHDVERAVAIFPEDVIWDDVSNAQPLHGKDAIRQYLQGWFSAFPDMQITVMNRVVAEDQVSAEIHFSGTNSGPLQLTSDGPVLPATGKQVSAKGTYFVRFQNGKPVEVHSYPDSAGMIKQLISMPIPTFAFSS